MTPEGVHAGRVLHVAVDRHLQRDGHGVDDGERWSRRSGWRCRDNAAIPAVDSRRYAQAHLAGRRIVELVEQDVRISQILTRAGVRERDPRERRGRRLDQRRHPPAGDRRPRSACRSRCRTGTTSAATCRRIVDLMPSGRFLMEDFYYAGGLPAVMRTLGEHGLLQSRRADGQRPDDLGELQGRAELERRSDPAVRSAAGGERRHRGAARQPRAGRRGAQAVGRVAAPDAASRPRRRVREHRALQRAHRRSGSRRRRRLRARAEELRPEGLSRAWRRSATWACRRRCCRPGVTDMVRISDARMSGTAYGTAVLHVVAGSGRRRSARARADGDMIELDVEARRAAARRQRRRSWPRGAPPGSAPEPAVPPGGYARLYIEHVQQADTGADLDFLVGCRGHAVARESH